MPLITLHKNILDIDIEKWNALSLHSPNSSFFQTYDCYCFYSSISFFNSFVYGVSEDKELKGIICGYIIGDSNNIKHFFSKRAIIDGGVLIDKNILDESLFKLLELLKNELRNKANYIEIRNYTDYSSYIDVFKQSGFSYQKHLNFHLSLDSSVFNRISESKRRQINAAKKKGIKWEITVNTEDVKSFYSILESLYKEKIGKPLFSIEFFQKLIRLPHAKLLVVKKEDEIIGGMVTVALEDKILYEWFVCGNDDKYKKLYPSVCATWAGITYAQEEGFRYFDFMGAGNPDKSYGVREFKSKFGGELVENGRFLLINNKFIYRLGKAYLKLKEKAL